MIANQTSWIVAASAGVQVDPDDLMPGGGRNLEVERQQSAERAERYLESKMDDE